MMLNSTKLLMTNSLMIGVIMTICSNNWISMWMGMELSLLSFIPLMKSKSKSSSQSMIKYFIMQSVASTLFLFSVIFMLIGVNMMNEMLMTISMLIKLGSAPFHNWLLMIIESIEYLYMFIMLTILKIPPLSILYQINTNMLVIPIVISMIISSISSLNQSSIRKILGYSSIYNMSLMMSSINNLKTTLIFILVYSINTMMVILVMKLNKINFINQIVFNDFKIWMKINVWINMLSMGGFPPTMGFLTKLLIIQNLLMNGQLLIVSILIMTSMLVLMFYTRVAFSSMMTSLTFKKWSLMYSKPINYLLVSSLLVFPMMLSMSITI
uniref:NADH dehydrogenase subunit 2 n=1 Tax=Leofa pulchella TaxID=1671235 RepID=UPI002435BBA9|nr:NADH dehydrogenase subunit 2 [Leofa pulchella]WEU77769.1 NADH dehydrogenase subunit 2 [Leofa pulchella]